MVSALSFLALVSACGGGGDGNPAPPALALPSERVSADGQVPAACTVGSAAGTVYANAEVEPFVAVNPNDVNHLVGVWQQDRWSNGGARALASAVSFDGGRVWSRLLLPMSRCAGAAMGGTGDWERASDPWVDIGSDGVVHVMGLAFSGSALQSGSRNAMLASRSTDGGRTFSAPIALIDDGAIAFNDKNTLTVDATDPRFVYATWDRLTSNGQGPAMLARSTDAGLSWEAARVIYDVVPVGVGGSGQTIGNRIVVITDGPDRGTLLNVFVQIEVANGQAAASVRVLRSLDQGQNWSAPIVIAAHQAVGARDPSTGAAIRDGAILPVVATGAGGAVWVAWQDARFSNGQRDAIALSRSIDGGRTWSNPVAVNKHASVPAFTPALHVRSDGTLGITHFDLRADTADLRTLLASAWLLTTADGVSFNETAVWGPFDLTQAPNARGLFLGDYQGLVSQGASFLPFLVMSGTQAENRTDVYALKVDPLVSQSAASAVAHKARQEVALATTESDATAARAHRHAAIVRAMERRVPGWSRLVGARPTPPE